MKISNGAILFIHAPILIYALLANQQPSHAAPISWKFEDGGNGHAYELVDPGPSGITWPDAKVAAESMTYLGHAGHLATVTSQEEWDFIIDNFATQFTWLGLTDEVQEGEFHWVTNEALTFTAWAVSPQEPNNAGNEDYVHMGLRDGVWGWNDNGPEAIVGGVPVLYLVEYPVPEPSTFLLAATGAAFLLLVFRRRRRRLCPLRASASPRTQKCA